MVFSLERFIDESSTLTNLARKEDCVTHDAITAFGESH